jgi:hypothetical protein
VFTWAALLAAPRVGLCSHLRFAYHVDYSGEFCRVSASPIQLYGHVQHVTLLLALGGAAALAFRARSIGLM